MSFTYAKKPESIQRKSNPGALSIVDASAANASLQRKADLLDEEDVVQNKSIQRVANEEEEELA